MGSEEPRRDKTVDQLIDEVTSPEPQPKESGVELAQREKIHLHDVLDKCADVRMLKICIDDYILVRVGRYWYEGTVVEVGKLGIVMENQGHEVAIALGKISVVEVLRRGKWYRLYRELRSKIYGG
ncbi:MAG: hypothetical protein GXO32_05175 [Crenarchaeota archaeon]|nr:hypothetical protein [Thermoproteota archaeon]